MAFSVITPYYVQPHSGGNSSLTIARWRNARSLPVMLYNNPGPAGGVKITPDTVGKLADSCRKHRRYQGFRVAICRNMIDYVRIVPDRVSVFQGRDTIIYPSLVCGAKGAVAASANVAPQLGVAIYEAFIRGDAEAAKAAQHRLHPVRLSLMLATAPGGPKAALKLLGIDLGPSRGPIAPLAGAALEQMREALREAGLIQ
jgi:4-hydroxy-tetrahydrodipicolinate synthase